MTETTPAPLAESPLAEILPVTFAPAHTMRCARCGAQGYVEVQLLAGGRIEFCSHHYTEHQVAIDLCARKIIDHRPYLRSLENQSRTKDDRR